jgi:cell division protein ZapA
MSGEAKAVPVNIMGREYRVSCTEDEKPQLLEAVALVNQKMLELKDRSKTVGLERIAVMAALNIAHEYLTTRVGGGFDIADFRRRISGMEATIDQAVADQDELF